MSRLEWENDVKDEIKKELEEIRDVKELMPQEEDDDKKTVWILFGTEGAKGKISRSKKVKFFGKGEGYDSLHEKLDKATNQIYFAVVRFYVLDVYKWILVSFGGNKVSRILKGQIFSFVEDIKKTFDYKHLVHQNCGKKLEFSIEEVMFKVKKSAGSNYSG